MKEIEILEKYVSNANDEEIINAWSVIKEKLTPDTSKELTEKGLKILVYMSQSEKHLLDSKSIASAIGENSRSVSGAMRKLVTSGYVEKMGGSPVVYSITEEGKTKVEA